MKWFRRETVNSIVEPLARMVEDLKGLAHDRGVENENITQVISALEEKRRENCREQIRALNIAAKVQEIVN